MKIKTKKTMNLPQLIEWGFEQKELPPLFYGSREGSLVQFTPGGWVNITGIEVTDTFTIEFEEELMEDTEIPKLMTTFKKTYLQNGFGYQRVRIDEDYTIKLMLDKAGIHGEPVETLHMVNDDGTHTLIWTKEKGLVK